MSERLVDRIPFARITPQKDPEPRALREFHSSSNKNSQQSQEQNLVHLHRMPSNAIAQVHSPWQRCRLSIGVVRQAG